jgi:hypothetical protein
MKQFFPIWVNPRGAYQIDCGETRCNPDGKRSKEFFELSIDAISVNRFLSRSDYIDWQVVSRLLLMHIPFAWETSRIIVFSRDATTV